MLVDDPDEVPADATPFDMRGVQLSHHSGGGPRGVSGVLYDGLYEYVKRAQLLGGEPA